MSPGFPGRESFVGQEGGKASLQSVRAAADRMCGVAIVTAFPVETQIASRTHEERLQQFAVGNLINFRCDIEGSAAYWHRSAKSQKPASRNKQKTKQKKKEDNEK